MSLTTETTERTLTRLRAEADFLCSIAEQAEAAGLHKIAEENRREYERCVRQIRQIRMRLEDLNARAEIEARRRHSVD
jgi:hypothetical protein